MKILHIINDLEIGGAEKLLTDFIKQYKINHPRDVHYIVTLNSNVQLLPEVNGCIREHSCLHFKRSAFWRSVRDLKQLLKKWEVDVIHAHLFYATILARLARRGSSHIRMVTTYHNMEYCSESPSYSWKLPFIDRLTAPRHNYHAIFVSTPVANCVTHQIPAISAFSILPNFVSKSFYPAYQFNDNNLLKLVAVGNLKAVKNHIYALRELQLLNDKRVSLDIYGKGDLCNELQSFITQHTLPVQLKQEVKITSELLAGYDAFLMPSTSEGMPVSLIEAIVTGLPSLLTDLPQLRDTAKDAALYFSLTKGSLCHILQQLLNDKKRLKHIADNAARLKEQFEINRYIEKVRHIYCGLSD